MTAADEQEVDRSPEALAERRDNLAARGITTAPTHIEGVTVTARVDPAIRPEPQRTRATRSDKGTKRAPKADPEGPGRVTEQERIQLCILLDDLLIAERAYWAADTQRAKAGVAYNAYLDRLAKNGRE